MSNLRGFGHKWSSSRLRIAIIHPAPLRANPYSTFARTALSSEIALAAVAGLSLQGHSVTLYTSGYRQKDIPDYLWDTSGDVKACLPRILRLALFPSDGEEPSSTVSMVVSALISFRIILNCMITFLVNLMWSVLPTVVQRARGGVFSLRHSPSAVLDVVITFGDTVLPQVLLSPFVSECVHFPLGLSLSDLLPSNPILRRILNLSHCELIVATTDCESVRWSLSGVGKQTVFTVYAPVVSRATPVTPVRATRVTDPHPDLEETELKILKLTDAQLRPFFAALAWYPNFSDLLVAVEAFAAFLASHAPPPGESEDDGCTGSARLLNLPRLVVLGVPPQDYLLLLREVNRLKLVEGEDVVMLPAWLPLSLVSQVLEKSVGIIHTPLEVNQIRIPCAGMLAGKPVITTVAFAASEPVRHESTGVLVKSRSPQLVAEAIDHVFNLWVSRAHEWARMGQRGRQRVLTEFSVEMFGSRLDDLFESSARKGSFSTLVSSPNPRPTLRRVSSSFHRNLAADLGE